ncbi:hypothetical protein [Lentibacillus salicampi]|nr:hypothetical protein [Lentibacillus salicampi]
MRQILMTLFIVMIVSFGIIGFAQTSMDTDDVVEEEDSHDNSIIVQ